MAIPAMPHDSPSCQKLRVGEADSLLRQAAATSRTSDAALQDDTAVGLSNTPPSEVDETYSSHETVDAEPLGPSLWRLYRSHFLSTWNARAFEFGAVLFLAAIFPGDLLPMSVYALGRAAAAVLLSPVVGRYIDTGERLNIIRNSIIWQRAAVLLSCAVLGTMVLLRDRIVTPLRYSLLAPLVVLACIEKLGAITNLVSVERDWVVAIANADGLLLRTMNSQMRRIDLFCKLVGPLAIAALDGWNTSIAIFVTLVSNAISLPVEYILIAQVYHRTPELAHQRSGRVVAGTPDRNAQDSEASKSEQSARASFWSNLRVYTSQPAFLASLSLSILYLTVLSFAGQMITFLLAMGYSSAVVGVLRVLSTGFEISATFLAPPLIKRIGAVRSALWFVNWQLFSLSAAGTLYWTIRDPFWAASSLVGGTILSRVGLWGFDLSVQITIQEEVEPEARGAFSTTEAGLQSLFEACAYASTMVFRRPEQFQYPVMISIIAVYLAGALYAKFVRDRRGHLLHASKCMKPRYTAVQSDMDS